MTSFDDVAGPLQAFVRREIDALTAVGQICKAVATSGPSVRCALVANESKGDRILTGTDGSEAALLLPRAVTRADTRRLLLQREAEPEFFDGGDAAFVASEPLMTRSGVYLGAIAAAGSMGDREAVLSTLPAAGRVCTDIALELLLGIQLGRKLHSFNNVLSILTANLEYVTDTIATTHGVVPSEEREQLVTAASYAARGAKQLIGAAIDLRDALPTGERPRPKRR